MPQLFWDLSMVSFFGLVFPTFVSLSYLSISTSPPRTPRDTSLPTSSTVPHRHLPPLPPPRLPTPSAFDLVDAPLL
ncbi:hypothetical protein B0H10DRAFT_2079687 [Mycena sp. CBHHK59/15]|nr:hypothetical protein B0H10DRAFT_2079687 [Mycena sp. CBHHK59/15]